MSFTSALKIAYVTAIYPAISITFVLREVEALRKLGIDVQTVSLRRPKADQLIAPAEVDAHDTTFYVLSHARRGLNLLKAIGSALRTPKRLWRTILLAARTAQPGFRGILYQIFYLLEAMVLARHLREQGLTHIHNHFVSASASVSMLASELTDIPFSFTLHGPTDLYEPFRWSLDEKIARATFVACISHFARSQAMLFSDPKHWDKLKIVHCGVTPELYDQPTSQDKAGINLLFVGRLAPVKGLRVLIAALSELRDRYPELNLTIVGDGEDREHLEALAAPLGDMVRFVGAQSQARVADFMAEADIFVLPSFAEGLPVVLMEALATGKPVIATRVAGVAELVEDQETGLLVHAGDRAGLVAAIEQLAQDRDLGVRMGAKGREVVRTEFDMRIEAARIASLFNGDIGPTLRPAPMKQP